MSVLFTGSTNHRNRGRASLRMLGVAMTVFLLLSVLTPLVQQAAAQDIVSRDDEDAALQQDPDGEGDGGEGTTEDQFLLQDDEIPEEEIDETYVAPAEPISFYINKHDCPSDFGGDIYELAANCGNPSYSVEWTVYGPNYTQFFNDDFGDEGLEAGVYQFRELIPSGYREPIVFCKFSDYLGNDNGMNQVVTYEGYYEVQIDAGLQLYCDWFNVPSGGGTVIINKHFCDPGFDAYNATIYELAPNCQTQEAGVSFELFANGSSYDTQVTGGQALTGLVQFDNVPGVPFSIVEGWVEGYGEPIIYCKLTDAAGVESGMEQYGVGFENAYYLDASVSVNEVLYCDWFNIPEYDGYGNVEVIKFDCPEALSPEASLGDYQYECWEPKEGVDFKLTSDSTGDPGNYLTDAEGKVSWGDREADHYYVTETELDGYGTPVVFCAVYYPDQNVSVEYLPYSVSADGQIEFDLEEGQYITCFWYNMPKYDDYGSITIIKYECLEVLDWEANFDAYSQDCTQPQADVDFKLTSDSTGDPGNYLTDANGEVTWGEREADHYYVTETIPSGYGTPVVYCDTYFPFDEQVPEFFGYEVSADGRIEFDLEEGQYIVCYWFNIPTGDDGGIIVVKYTCPQFQGIVELTYEYLLDQCPDRTDGIPYSLELQGNDYLEWSETGDYDAGSASFDGLGEGTYSLTEDKPEGYGKPIVFCQRYVEDGGGVTEYTEYTATDLDGIEFELGQYEGIVCHWFNFPYEDSTVTVHKYICAEDISLDEDQSYYQDECTVAHEGVTFNLDGESTGDQGSEVTDGDGNVSWDGLDTDLYTLDEEIPSGYGDPIVFCGFTAFYNGAVYDGFPVRIDEVYDGAVELDISVPNSSYFCWYFNIPTYDSSITIYKWLCPEDFELYDDAEAICTEPLNGVTFTADGPDGYHKVTETGDDIDYAVKFDGLYEGTYEIDETLPWGIEYGFVAACWGNSNPVPAVYPLYNTANGGPFSLELAKGDHVSCTWYNVPTDKEDGTLTVYKYLCDGYVISDWACDLYRDGQAFSLDAASGAGDPIDFETGADGSETLTLPAGTWNLDEIGGEWCKAESADLNGSGQIVTTEGHESIVYIYNCTPPTKTPPVKQPPTKAPPIKEFPNTGSGPVALATDLSGGDLAGQALILLLVAQGLVLVALRRGGALGFIANRIR